MLWLTGRKDVFNQIKHSGIDQKQVIWVHTASLGEFEQGRPIVERIKQNYPEHSILLTFFSPSGYEIRKNYEKADLVTYLPVDTPKNASRFVSLVNPELAIFIKYEFWFNYIDVLYKNKIPTIFASVIFRPSQHFFKPWGSWFAQQLNKITYIFVQDEKSVDLLDSIKIYHAEVGGDTRFDRVIQLPEEKNEFPEIKSFIGDSKIIVGGSTWSPDEDNLRYVIEKNNDDIKLIIAPHLIDDDHISEIQKKFREYNPVLYSDLEGNSDLNSRVLIINEIGLLSSIYRYAKIAYIGGGFGVGIHNLLEASTYGVPVIFGPNHQKFREAIELISIQAGFGITNKTETLEIINKLLSDNNFFEKSSIEAKQYVAKNAGATNKVIGKVKEFIVAG